MPVARWYIARSNEKVGPFSAVELQQMARFGLLQPSEHIWVEGSSKWMLASSVPTLFSPPAQRKYWLLLAGQTRGPFIAEQIRAGLNAHQFTLETHACADEARQWMPLSELPEFRDFKLETAPLTASRAQYLVGLLEFEEVALHMAGKSGDELAKLMSLFMDLKRNCAANPALVANLDETIAQLRTKREELAPVPALGEAPQPSKAGPT